MHDLRDALLSSSPEFPLHLRGLDRIMTDQLDVIQGLELGQDIRLSIRHNRTWIVSERYCSLGDGVDSLGIYLHSLWHAYYQLGRRTAHDTAEHDRLVLDIVRIKGLGILTRPVAGNYGIDVARTTEGTLWNDLPFLVTDMTDFWLNNCATMSGTQRLNFASFLAKLASTRVAKDRVCQIGLFLLRYTFEDQRELVIPGEEDEESPKRTMNELDIARFLPSACAWIREAGHNLTTLSEVHWNDCPSVIGQGGQWFLESDLGKRSPTGFTPWRWMYWVKRLHEIREESKHGDHVELEKLASVAINLMVNRAKERKSDILRVYREGGDALHKEEYLKCLVEE